MYFHLYYPQTDATPRKIDNFMAKLIEMLEQNKKKMRKEENMKHSKMRSDFKPIKYSVCLAWHSTNKDIL